MCCIVLKVLDEIKPRGVIFVGTEKIDLMVEIMWNEFLADLFTNIFEKDIDGFFQMVLISRNETMAATVMSVQRLTWTRVNHASHSR